MITIVFEDENLVVTSKETVSIWSIVYMEPSNLDIKPIYIFWIKDFDSKLDTIQK